MQEEAEQTKAKEETLMPETSNQTTIIMWRC
jgi:hypothetical protein